MTTPTTEPKPFDPDEPLPVFPDYRARSWEPAENHYVDLTETEKSEQ